MTIRRDEPTATQDQKLEMAIGMMLRVGVSIAAAVILLGGVLYLRHPGGACARLHAFPRRPRRRR